MTTAFLRPSSSAATAALADEAAAKSKETAEKKKKGKRSDTCDKFVGVGFHCGQRNDDDDTAVQEQNRSCRSSRSEILKALAISVENDHWKTLPKYQNRINSPLLRLGPRAGVPESLGEGVVVNLELSNLREVEDTLLPLSSCAACTLITHLLVLVGGDGDELGLLEDVRPERGVGQLDDVVGSDEVKSRLVLVHRVQDGLQKGKGEVNETDSKAAF